MEISDIDLVVRAQAGDPQAFAPLVDRYRTEIVRLVRRFARGADDAQDLAQEAFVAAFQHLPTLREPEKFAPWLHRIALNAARQWWRRESQISLEPLWDDSELAPASGARGADASLERLRALVQDALAALPPESRSVVLLHYFDGYDYGETAALLDVPVSTVRGRLHLARRKLREEMAELAPQKGKSAPPHAVAQKFTLDANDLAALRGAELLGLRGPAATRAPDHLYRAGRYPGLHGYSPALCLPWLRHPAGGPRTAQPLARLETEEPDRRARS